MIDVAFTPSQLRRCDVAIVIDVLRATSTATVAFDAGFARVLCVPSVEHALTLRGPGRVLAGERQCLMPDGFDLGNSPRDLAGRRGDTLVLASTNGTPAVLVACRRARVVLVACLMNLDAVRAAVSSMTGVEEADVSIVCSGTDGEMAFEDVYVAGLLTAALPGERSDAALVAEATTRGFASAEPPLAGSRNGRRLLRGGMSSDISFCARTSVLGVVPHVVEVEAGVAALQPWDGSRDGAMVVRHTVEV